LVHERIFSLFSTGLGHQRSSSRRSAAEARGEKAGVSKTPALFDAGIDKNLAKMALKLCGFPKNPHKRWPPRQQGFHCGKVGFILASPPLHALITRFAVLQKDTHIDIAIWPMIAPHTAAEQIGVKAFRWLKPLSEHLRKLFKLCGH
jgi:hypothetical protein